MRAFSERGRPRPHLLPFALRANADLEVRAPILALIFFFFALSAHAEEFVPGITDLPLMPGLEAAEAAPVVFDKPAGRIVETTARGGKPEAVAQFYRATLPELGWIAAPGGGYNVLSYRREHEALRIEIGRDGTVRFLLAPQ